MNIFLLIALYIATLVSPLLLSWSLGLEPRPWRYELATGMGILAYSIILLEFFLSGRFKSISRTVGMDVTMRLHQLMARAAVAFAVVHPLLYSGSPAGGVRPWDPSRQLTLTTDFFSLASGIAALLVLPSLVVLAIGRSHFDYKYETWRWIHGLGAAALAGLLLHHTISAGRYGAQPALTWFWSAMTALALGSLFYVYVISPLRQRRAAWKVTSLVQRTPKQWELTVSPDGHSGFDYAAGQFAWLNVGHNAFSLNENPFSISSAPTESRDVSFLIKELGDFTRTLGEVELGTRAYIDGPYGNLFVDGRTEPGVALIAGGVGLAPLLGILRHVRLTNDPRKTKLVYGNRTEQQIACPDELGTRDVTYVLSEPPDGWPGEIGFIDGALLDRVFSAKDYRDWVFVLCGPKAMLDVVEDHLKSRNVAPARILSERFDYD